MRFGVPCSISAVHLPMVHWFPSGKWVKSHLKKQVVLITSGVVFFFSRIERTFCPPTLAHTSAERAQAVQQRHHFVCHDMKLSHGPELEMLSLTRSAPRGLIGLARPCIWKIGKCWDMEQWPAWQGAGWRLRVWGRGGEEKYRCVNMRWPSEEDLPEHPEIPTLTEVFCLFLAIADSSFYCERFFLCCESLSLLLNAFPWLTKSIILLLCLLAHSGSTAMQSSLRTHISLPFIFTSLHNCSDAAVLVYLQCLSSKLSIVMLSKSVSLQICIRCTVDRWCSITVREQYVLTILHH